MIKSKRPDSVCIFTLDRYYKDVQYVNSLRFRHDNPESIDYQKAINDLNALCADGEIKTPLYDYDSHAIVGYDTLRIADVIIVEGLFVYSNEQIRDLLDFKIWVEADDDVLLQRRLTRDVESRGDSYEEALLRYNDDVRPAYVQYVAELKRYADIVINNNPY